MIFFFKMETVRNRLQQIGRNNFLALQRSYQQQEREGREISAKRTRCRNAIEESEAWLKNYLCSRSLSVEGLVVLDNFDWTRVYHEFTSFWHNNRMDPPPSRSSFIRGKHKVFHLEKVKIYRPQDHPVCSQCIIFQEEMRNPNADSKVYVRMCVCV